MSSYMPLGFAEKKNELSAIASAMQAIKSISVQECNHALRGIEMLGTLRYRFRAFLENDKPDWLPDTQKNVCQARQTFASTKSLPNSANFDLRHNITCP